MQRDFSEWTHYLNFNLKKRKHIYLLAFFLCLMVMGQPTPCLAGGEQPVVSIDSLTDQYIIKPEYLRMVEDFKKEHSLESVRQLEFEPLSQFPTPNKRLPASVYWIKMILENQTGNPLERWLLVEANFTHAFLIRASGKVQQSQAGLMMPHKEKTIQAEKIRQSNYIPINLNEGEKATLYLRNQYPGSFPPLSEIHILESPQFVALKNLQERGKVSFFNGFFQALLLLLILYSLFYAIYAKEQFAVDLTLYCFFMSVYFLNADGYFYRLGWLSNAPFWINMLGLSMVNFSIVFELRFIQQYLSLNPS